ncbi:MAG: hypothetical protein E6R03_10600 [Hyphomicrobiaceae bacterium]|nr:MAG: hypothetical protein E6R03_10600 [Hyphomicrobiaceae bacterium]
MDNNNITGDYLKAREDEIDADFMNQLEEGSKLDPAYVQRQEAMKAKQEAEKAADPPVNEPQQSGTDPFGRPVAKTNMTRQIAGGAFDAVNETFNMLDDFDKWWKDVWGVRKDIKINEPLPTIEKPDTTAQGVARGVSQFLTGFAGAGKVLKPVQAVGKGARLAKAAAQGAMADFSAFDPHQERLSNLVQKYDALKNPVTEYLAADPTDSNAEGRFKNSLEGLGVGAAVDGFVKSVRVLRQASIAKKAAPLADDAMKSVPFDSGIKDEAFSALGDVNAPLIVKQPSKLDDAMKAFDVGDMQTDQAAKGLVNVTQTGTEDVYVNFARMESPDEVKSVIAQMADSFSKNIDEAKRGVMAQEETKRLADDLGLTVDDLLKRRQGQGFNAETALAARKLWASSAEKLHELAKKAADPKANDVDRFNFRKMLATHYAIQTEVIAARTETARSLASWKIPVGGNERAKAIETALNEFGGNEVTSELAKRIASMSDNKALAQMVEKSVSARTLDAVKESYVLGLLWNPKTHIVNMSSNTMVAFQQIYERAAAAKIGQFLGKQAGDGVAIGEAGALYYGLRTGIADAFRNAYQALKSGETGIALGKVEGQAQKAISKEALGIKNSTLGKAVDMIGATVRAPGRALSAEDEFFKTIGYRMELHAQAYRQAYSEGLYADKKAFGERVAQIVQNPPENVRMAAADAALYSTFTNKTGKWGQVFQSVRNDLNIGPVPVGTMILPFVRTPTNIFRYALERTPMAPLVEQWRADIAAGGARSDLALARMSTGSTIMFIAGDYASNGVITGAGPDDPGEREALIRQGWQPYSLVINGKTYSYGRTDPIGMTIGIAADMQELVNRYDIEPEEMDEVNEIIGATVAAVAQSSVNKTYMTGISRIVQAIEDPDRYAGDYVAQTLSSMVPAVSAMGAVEQALDPDTRETMKMLDYVQAKIPALSEKLTKKRDLWGNPLNAESVYGQAYDSLSPIPAKEIKDSPIDREMVRLNMNVLKIKKKQDFEGVPVNFRDYPEVYEEYQILAGRELALPKYGNKGCKDYLDSLVSGNSPQSKAYARMSDGEEGGKSNYIRKIIRDYRSAARDKIMKDPRFSDFQLFIDKGQRAKRQAKMPSALMSGGQ